MFCEMKGIEEISGAEWGETESVFSVLVMTLRQRGVAGFVTVLRKRRCGGEIAVEEVRARFPAGNCKISKMAGLYVESVGCV